MSGGTISNNINAGSTGGNFFKTGGTVYGNDAATPAELQNISSNPANGAAVCMWAAPYYKRNTTAGPTVNLRSDDPANWE
ncbi:MAG: hypothetical protein LBR86_00460 [Tannerella sp.]|jgi:hypothetical protein|nr:hypothetical protein [Tannerella sp.]